MVLNVVVPDMVVPSRLTVPPSALKVPELDQTPLATLRFILGEARKVWLAPMVMPAVRGLPNVWDPKPVASTVAWPFPVRVRAFVIPNHDTLCTK